MLSWILSLPISFERCEIAFEAVSVRKSTPIADVFSSPLHVEEVLVAPFSALTQGHLMPSSRLYGGLPLPKDVGNEKTGWGETHSPLTIPGIKKVCGGDM